MNSHALIIEDDQDTASLFSHILEFIGFTTEIIRSGELAMSRLQQIVPDIVLLDIMLSQGISGLNILDYIKGEERLNNCRVIVITGYPSLAESIGEKADLILLKPISAKQLSAMVLRLCPNHIYENFLYNASYDPVTGLMNYARFKDRLSHAVRRAKRIEELYFALAFIRVQGLTALKKTHGQSMVNKVLNKLVQKMKDQIREADTLARVSENKLAILFENIREIGDKSILDERIRNLLGSPIRIQGERFLVEANVDIIHEDFIDGLDAFLMDDR
jgi:PleD family two-component response regulator